MPACSTTKTRATQIVPRMTTVSFIKMSAPLRVKGVFIKGLTKSSSTTAAMEFKPVDNELKESDLKLINSLSPLLFFALSPSPFPLLSPPSLPPFLPLFFPFSYSLLAFSPSFFSHHFLFPIEKKLRDFVTLRNHMTRAKSHSELEQNDT